MDDNGKIGAFHPVPWHFNSGTMSAAGLWSGTYKGVPGDNRAVACKITGDAFTVDFVTSTKFVATKNDALYRFGIRL